MYDDEMQVQLKKVVIFFIDEKREHIIEGNVIISITNGARKYNNDVIYKNCYHNHTHI